MTALDRALAWFLEPPTPDGADTPGTQAAAGEPDATERRAPRTAWLRPVAGPDPLAPPAHPADPTRPAGSASLGGRPGADLTRGGRGARYASLDALSPHADPTRGGRGAGFASLDALSPHADPARGAHRVEYASLDALSPHADPACGGHRAEYASLDGLPPGADASRGGIGAGFVALGDGASARPVAAARPPIGCAAVLGRPGQAEPIAAAVALALGAAAPGRAATVALIEPADREAVRDAEPRRDSPPASGGTRAARRLAARLDAHGLAVRPRGRLVWVDVPLEGRRAAAQRAALVGAPAVLAVTAPRAPDIEELLAEQDLLLLVTADPAGPLARVAALAHGGVPVAVTRPLPRGPARSLALAGIAAPRGIRRLAAGATAPWEPA